jgi:chromosome partition protein MukF
LSATRRRAIIPPHAAYGHLLRMIPSDRDHLPRLIAALARDHVALDLKTVDLCFLSTLYLRADRAALASFDEDLLVDMFEQTCDIVEPEAENPRKRATHAIQRLREQRMLVRVDGAGIIRAGEYALTRLAAAVVEYFLADEALTRESLTLLTGILRAQLSEMLVAAKKANGDEDWRRAVVGPLRVTVADLVGGIERRQRGLDAQQEEVQAEIAQLLQADWFGAVERCQSLLDTTTSTLRELNDVLLRDTHHFLATLQEIQTLAASAGRTDAEETSQRVIEHVDRIAAWGAARQRAWSDYYQYVHRYLRDVVRLDPDRALSHRLRDQIVGWTARPFFILAAHAPAIRLLRTLEARVNRPAVARPRADREAPPTVVSAEDALGALEALVRAALAAGAVGLANVTARVLVALAPEVHYAAAGRVADALARITRTRSERERPWRPVADRLEIEDWDAPEEGDHS